MTTDVPDELGFVVDASVLIDYIKSDITILTLVSRHIAPIHVASPILAEVQQLSAAAAAKHGLQVVEPSLEQVEAALSRKGRTSFQDRLCALVARENAWICLTSDANLRSFCSELGVTCAWGLEPMHWLVARRRLAASRALAVAKNIARVNPFVTPEIIARFRTQLGL
ncbi:MAG TPA: hypothetical protein EYP56_01380 [Planctomycetaceae bacterium]|nr:hypothetical protein [Planctomycetaceae bacterium]